MNYFITGTDTGVGKTYVTSLILRGLRKAGLDAVGMKPICCGDREDAELLHKACDEVEPLDLINPVWFEVPAAPYTASLVEKRQVDLEAIFRSYRKLRKAHRSILVEGVGGWMVPIAGRTGAGPIAGTGLTGLTRLTGVNPVNPVNLVPRGGNGYFVSDLAAEIALPVVVVVGNRLGAINHTLLTIQSIRASGQECAGIILNHCEAEMDLIAASTNRAVLEHLLDVPILFEIHRDQEELELAIA